MCQGTYNQQPKQQYPRNLQEQMPQVVWLMKSIDLLTCDSLKIEIKILLVTDLEPSGNTYCAYQWFLYLTGIKLWYVVAPTILKC